MSVFFNWVRIQNFKSLKDATLQDFKRINVLIGKPNVGKSNILEAIGLFSLPYVELIESKKITQFIKLDSFVEIFYDGNTDNKIEISADNENLISIRFQQKNLKEQLYIELVEQQDSFLFDDPDIGWLIEQNAKTPRVIVADGDFNLLKKNTFDYASRVKYFKFPSVFLFENQSFSGLIPPSGVNLFEIAEKSPLKQDLSKLFLEYRLKLLFDKTNHTLRIVKELNDNSLVSLPFTSMADTLQRIVFFKAAIASNTDSILLFEEPEAHCFPPYIAHITQEVIAAKTNQFFIATHSPYVLNAFLEQSREELAVFIIDYQDGQTVINRLTDAELNEVYDYGIDVFFNYERFTQHG